MNPPHRRHSYGISRGLKAAWLGCLLAAALPAAPPGADESVLLFPTLGWQAGHGWAVSIHGRIFEREARPVVGPLLRRLTGIDPETLSPEERATFRERTRLFLTDSERNKKLRLELNGRTHTLPASEANGHFQAELRLTGPPAGPASRLPTTVPGLPGSTGRVHLLAPTGWSVISDIDDTVKISVVTNQAELLRNTFCRPFRPVPGMAERYRGWAGTHGAAFHYVSASPWQLYEPLAAFLDTNRFPQGSMHLKLFRAKDRTVMALWESPERYKPGVIEPVLRRYPGRQFVLVGDSGEKDPEIYGTIARRFPGQVRAVFIRDVTGEPAEGARYVRAFRGVPRERWRVFRDAVTLPGTFE